MCLIFCHVLRGFLIFFIGVSYGQNEKAYFEKNKKLGGDIVILKASVNTEGNNSYRVFEIEVPEDGEYYLNSWFMPSNDQSGIKSYNIIINGEESSNKLKPKKDGWQTVGFKNKTGKLEKITLKAGVNTISFKGDLPEIPDVEFIRLSKDKKNANISEDAYNGYISAIKEENKKREIHPVIVPDSVNLKSYTLPNPEGNYLHHMDVSYRYTTYKYAYFSSGQSVSVQTQSIGTYVHVLEVFKSSDPASNSWAVKSSSSGAASLNLNITSTGTYCVRVRAYQQNTVGLVDLQIGSDSYNTCPVSGSGFRSNYDVTEELNFFTSHISTDTRIWIESGSGFPGKIIAYNDDYYGDGDWNWGLASRVKQTFSDPVGATLISAYSSNSPVGNCDLYMGCQNSNIMNYFPNLEADDAIQSAPYDYTYNCISWSVGIFEDWSWPSGFGSDFSVVEDFYENYGYTATGANSSNSVVDLWAYNGDYTHASVTKPGNDHPHGYDWESKPGALMRTFHPRNSLEGSSYGEVVDYFIESSFKSTSLLAEKIAKGTDVIENVEFTSAEDKYIEEKVNSLDNKEILEEKYTAWKNTWTNPDIAIHSNPRKYAESDEYDEFIEYCKLEGEKVWPFVFEKFGQGQEEFMAINAIEDLTADTHKDLMQQVLEGNKLKSTTKSGAHIHRFPYCNTMKYIQAILKSTGELTNVEENAIMYSNSFDFNVYPNPATPLSQISFDLPHNATVSVWIIDMNGRTISTTINKQTLASGSYTYNLNIPDNAKGIYLVNFKVNNNYNVKRIVVQ
jgi:hypothetical protein